MEGQLSYAPGAHSDVSEYSYTQVVDEICGLNWSGLSREGLISVAWAYYYFSVQFRENLEAARKLHPDDERLQDLDRGERDTDNLSPWPGVAQPGEKMNHDEFMRRTLMLTAIADEDRRSLETLGEAYLAKARSMDELTKALSIASYEDGGLEAVFGAFLKAKNWDGPLLGAFKHFLSEHIRFDSDPEAGHGALCRHLTPDDRILPLWIAFRQLLTAAAPELSAKSS
jgi:hypothetical protein